jgi:hypothetical protein
LPAGAGGGAGASPAKGTPWLREPSSLHCPACAIEFDTTGRLPVVLACACQHTVCRKCAGALAAVPRGAGLPEVPPACPLCGLKDGPGYDLSDCAVSTSVLLTLVSKKTPAPRLT